MHDGESAILVSQASRQIVQDALNLIFVKIICLNIFHFRSL